MAKMRACPIVGAVDVECVPRSGVLEPARSFADAFSGARVRRVQVVRSPSLDRRSDPSGATRIWLALEYMQITGSFKVRGALYAAAKAKREGVKNIVAVSAGNHGIGVAFAEAALGIKTTIVVPSTAPKIKRDKISAYGANIVISKSAHYDGAEAEAKALARETGAKFLSPYDDVDVVIGNGATLGFEIVSELGGVPDRVIAPFGGGGLATGIAWSLVEESNRTDAVERRVWGVQSEASPVMALSLERNVAIENFIPMGVTLAEGLEGGISASAFARARAVIGGVLVTPESNLAIAMKYAKNELGNMIEGSAAAALVPALVGLPPQLRGGDVVIVLTGMNVDEDRIAALSM